MSLVTSSGTASAVSGVGAAVIVSAPENVKEKLRAGLRYPEIGITATAAIRRGAAESYRPTCNGQLTSCQWRKWASRCRAPTTGECHVGRKTAADEPRRWELPDASGRERGAGQAASDGGAIDARKASNY